MHPQPKDYTDDDGMFMSPYEPQRRTTDRLPEAYNEDGHGIPNLRVLAVCIAVSWGLVVLGIWAVAKVL